MTFSNLFRGISLTAFILFLFTAKLFAVPPSPEAVERWKAEGTFESNIAGWQNFKQQYSRTYKEYLETNRELYKTRFLTGQADLPDTLRLPVIVIEFTDHPADGQAVGGTPAQFDSILFSTGNFNPTGSMTDFYLENSYGSFYVTGKIHGWYTMPQTYSWYVADDYGLSRSETLATDAVMAADNDIDFADYDADNDGVCDGVIIIHSGPGAEQYGAGHIWSHRAWIFSTLYLDGIRIFDYNVNPEEFGSTLSPIGVVCHEFGHILDLPDLYDINYTDDKSEGLGRWSLMAGGSYNGSGRSPAHLDAWSKIFLGFVQPIMVDTNLKQAAIPQAATNPVIYALLNGSASATEYWLVENRQQVGFDSTLPGDGLLIYHIDEAATFSNSDPYRYHVALEQADGRNSLAFGGSSGDGSDPWPGNSDNYNFHDLSLPNSRTNIFQNITEIGVWNISESGATMYADLDISFSRPYIMLKGNDSIRFDDSFGGNGNTMVEQGETVELYIRLVNYMISTGYADVTLSVSNPRIQVTQGTVTLDNAFTGVTPVSNLNQPLIFSVPADFETSDVTFTLALSIDSTLSEGPGVFKDTIEFVETVGTTDYIVINSGHSDVLNTETVYKDNLQAVGEIARFWDKSRSFPGPDFLDNFKAVFWVTDTSTENIFTADDIAAMKSFLDHGRNLCIVSPYGAEDLIDLDSAFVSDYLRINLQSFETSAFAVYGIAGNPVSEGVQLYLNTGLGFNGTHKILQPVNDGEKAFELSPAWGGGTVGVSYDGSYRTLFLTYPIETVFDDKTPDFDTKADLFERIVLFMNGGDITGVENENVGLSLPKSFALYQNYPNPFNPSTVIKYILDPANGGRVSPERTRLAVYNLLGREIKTLVDEVQPAGTYEVTWDGSSDIGERVATGVYFYRLERGDIRESKKMLLLK